MRAEEDLPAEDPPGQAEAGHLAAAEARAVGEEAHVIDEIDKQRISNAIQQAELKTAGEIFCVIARSSDDYHHLPVIWAALIALFVPLPLVYVTFWSTTTIYLVQIFVFLVVAVLLSHPKLRFHIVPRQAKHDQAHAEALRQFFLRGLDKTENRTGVLIFASTAERYAEIIADTGINQMVPTDAWDKPIKLLVGAIKAGHPADGFVAAIEECGAILSIHFPPGTLNRDELPNKLLVI